MDENNEMVYREVQRPRQIWYWGLILAVAVLMWYWFIQQIVFGVPIGNNPAPDVVTIILWVLFGIAFPVIMLGVLKLVVEVHHDGVYIRFVPFHIHYRKYLFKDIRDYQRMTYSPLKRFGGWGLRFNFENEKAYNLIGKEGIELSFNYSKLVIGTQKPDELKRAIDSVRKEL
ncbi:DUF6141 family protein [Barrientosiimonas marina]|uniref:DUF6141 family protein n=1 Tax=Lentibacillus kimchii TaxID=1542911 RepID=A0ABW2UTL0_9BACI